MPASGPVYQPTTVGYEQQNEWSRPGSYLSQTVSTGLRGPRCVQWLLLALSLFSLLVGIILVIESTVEFADNQQTTVEDEAGNKKQVSEGATGNIVITIVGALLILVGIILLGAYIRLIRRRKGCPCFPTKEQRLARQLDTQTTNGQIMTLNPSTDLLVAAQYGPVSEITYQPPQASEEEETRKLMASDNKEGISMKRTTKGQQQRRSVPVDRYRNRVAAAATLASSHSHLNRVAPLASHEEITPSLRSSFCSDYYQRSLLDSSSDNDNADILRNYSHSDRTSSNSIFDNNSIRSSLLESTINKSVSNYLLMYKNNAEINYVDEGKRVNVNNDLYYCNNDELSNVSSNNGNDEIIIVNNNHNYKSNDNNNTDNDSYLPYYCTTV